MGYTKVLVAARSREISHFLFLGVVSHINVKLFKGYSQGPHEKVDSWNIVKHFLYLGNFWEIFLPKTLLM